MLAATQVVFFCFPCEVYFRTAGLTLAAWGFFTLYTLLKITAVSGAGDRDDTLSGRIVLGLHNAISARRRLDISLLTRNTALAYFATGLVYVAAHYIYCAAEGDSAGCMVAFLPFLASCTVTGLVFWVVQAYSLRYGAAAFLMTCSCISAVGIFAWLLFTGDVSVLEPGDIIPYEALKDGSNYSWVLLYLPGSICAGVYLYGLLSRQRHRGFPLTALALVVSMAVIDNFYTHNPSLSAVYLACWAGMGVGWAQSWPRSGMTSRSHMKALPGENFLTLEQK